MRDVFDTIGKSYQSYTYLYITNTPTQIYKEI